MASSPHLSASWKTAAWIAVSLAIFFGMVSRLWQFTIDDTYISARYARNLADGYGMVFSPGAGPSEGYSNLLWILMLAGLTRLGADTMAAAKLLSLLLGALTVAMSATVARRVVPQLYGPVPVLCGACTPLALWSTDGLGTAAIALVTLIWLYGATDLMLRPERRMGHWLMVSASLAAPLLRPEGLLLAALYPVALLMWRQATGRRIAWGGPVLVALALCLLELWRLQYFGKPLPLPFYAKVEPASLQQKLSGVLYLHRFIWQYLGGALGYLAIGYGLVQLAGWWTDARPMGPEKQPGLISGPAEWQADEPLLQQEAVPAQQPSANLHSVQQQETEPERAGVQNGCSAKRLVHLALLATAPWVVFVLLVGADWMPQYRFLVPAVAPLYMLLMALLARLVALLQISAQMARGFLAAGVATVLIGSGLGMFSALQTDTWHSFRTEQIAFHVASIEQLTEQGKWLEAQGGACRGCPRCRRSRILLERAHHRPARSDGSGHFWPRAAVGGRVCAVMAP